MRKRNKSCGSCGDFLKVKHMQDNSGICHWYDSRINTDDGHDCKHWIGIKYQRPIKSKTRELLNDTQT